MTTDTSAIIAETIARARPFAIDIARQAGSLLRERLHGDREIEHKGLVDLVTDADEAAEYLIAEGIRTAFPDHRLIGEEGARSNDATPGTDGFGWVIDPLDGTTNFAHRYPHFAVSIALEYEATVVLGVIYDPNRDEMFVATRSGGATLNEQPIHVSDTAKVIHGLLATGFSYDISERGNGRALWNVFNDRVQGLRRDGSAALNLAYVAAGRLDAYYEQPVEAWDKAAGTLLVEEAGGTVTAFDGSDLHLFNREVVSSNAILHAEVLALIDEALSATSGRP